MAIGSIEDNIRIFIERMLRFPLLNVAFVAKLLKDNPPAGAESERPFLADMDDDEPSTKPVLAAVEPEDAIEDPDEDAKTDGIVTTEEKSFAAEELEVDSPRLDIR